ncbi:hypothetical protein FisN_19Hh112 [Fistulifera solaris]|uniref:MAGE domain-containing protein n=1 Tax=Fistulifera solaris TaxID=1519565 RepID=A0A1Z5JZS4_FISSO|nr:hypothetical protein FisN_19Hh112 [Fistulifera solaris]|eukprot:GAX19535.1 hypothetical protein FisN_19Hh112 [Fistulifera solaris]
MPPSQRRSQSQRTSFASQASRNHDDDMSEDEVEPTQSFQALDFSQRIPDETILNTQEIHSVKAKERENLNRLDETQREKAISDLTRLLLFKGLAGESLDRLKCAKEADLPPRITSAAFDEANKRLQNCFDFELKRIPAWMENMKDLPQSKKDRYYLVNCLKEDETGEHSKALHSVHEDCSINKGLLMVILALCYCEGEPKTDGSRWLRDDRLYELLHRLDENIPKEPPRGEGSSSARSTSHPNVDAALVKFVHQDYLLCIKEKDPELTMYCLGPRAAMEIGRKQILYFCSQILGQDPDPSMLLELEQDEPDQGVEEEEVE